MTDRFPVDPGINPEMRAAALADAGGAMNKGETTP